MNDSPSDQQSTIDWVNLPAGATELSLWECLHDAGLESATLDRLGRTLLLEFEVGYLRTFNNLAENSQFLLKLSGLQSLRVIHRVLWPGDFSVPDGTPREVDRRMRVVARIL